MTLLTGGNCCPVVTVVDSDGQARERALYSGDLSLFVRQGDDPVSEIRFLIDGIHCGGCIQTIERGLLDLEGVDFARVNLSTSRLTVKWQTGSLDPFRLIERLAELGYHAVPYDPDQLDRGRDSREKGLLRAMAVSGFAAANVMLLSVAVWAGQFSDMGPHTRSLMHWLSALVAIPAIIYAGRPFFDSALSVLRHGRTNMDVPISLGVLLATGMSLSETMRGAEHTYFDSAITLLFFLLIGRYLDVRTRGKAKETAEYLLSLNATTITILNEDGRTEDVQPSQVRAGMTVLVANGQRIPVDGTLMEGISEVDTSVITGESVPQSAREGDKLYAGTLNLGAPMTVHVDAVGEGTLLAEICRLMESAEQRKGLYVSVADRISRAYAPIVHALAAITFLGWMAFGTIGWQESLMVAIAVLIITCPCALGLAVPVVQVVASSRLMKQGILLKSGSALERLNTVNTIVFDKTGTLTLSQLSLIAGEGHAPADLALAASAAANSSHPLARSLTAAADGGNHSRLTGVREVPGCGLEWENAHGKLMRLGSRRWLGIEEDDNSIGAELWMQYPDGHQVSFHFEDGAKLDAKEEILQLRSLGYEVHLLSGDREATVRHLARQLGIDHWKAACSPGDKVAMLENLARRGRITAMVGDGINDAPALASAHVSLSPTSAADVSQNTADIVFQGDLLHPVRESLLTAKRATSLVQQNFALAFLYNILTVPLAVAGFVTPLIAAIAMSSSSILVVANALRLGGFNRLPSNRN
ncbi:heavy metal translocating P-type ATPase [Aestuariispira insulae]|uniref:Cu2+-exporting ATPase n=1 Tax=Aestuariispira insulae TaxID=1461337 RepID=A0A3D9HND2_9PROT|nr:heavy metal translocating P-type ATPase [Aestuariispira insulae]RED51017.1 Cu2+-exporting ATPase [Aestuariispira insulae]